MISSIADMANCFCCNLHQLLELQLKMGQTGTICHRKGWDLDDIFLKFKKLSRKCKKSIKKKQQRKDLKCVCPTSIFFPTLLRLGQFADCNHAAFVPLHMISAKWCGITILNSMECICSENILIFADWLPLWVGLKRQKAQDWLQLLIKNQLDTLNRCP